VPAGLEARILQSTIGNVLPQEVRAPLTARLLEWLRGALDPIVSPQLASVATMLLVSIFVLTNTVSTDGSVGGILHAGVQLAQRTADNASRSSALPNGMKKLEDDFIGNDTPAEKGSDSNKNQNQSSQSNGSQTQSKQKDNGAPKKNR